MNGIRTLVLQDLSHILPPKGLQLHTTASSRRFWNFFEFSLKEDATCRDPKKCPSSKDIVSSSLLSNEFESVPRNRASLSAGSAISPNLNPKIHVYQYDEKSNPVNRPRIPRPLSQPDDLVSLLDGNPVPKTMKWKLKGYKTLRHEQSSDFAFVPGGNCYDLDILSRNEHNAYSKVKNKGAMNENTLYLTTKAIENKQNDVEIEKQAMQPESNSLSSSNYQNVSHQTSNKTMQKLLTTVAKKEDQFLPIQSKLSQQSAQYSSHPPKRISKPLPPGIEANRDKHLMEDAKSSHIDKPTLAPSLEAYQQHASTEESSLTHTEVYESVPSEWSSMEQPRPTKTELRHDNERMENPQLSSRMADDKLKEDNRASFSKPPESTYFAPRPWKYSNLPKSSLTSKSDSKSTYESILGIPSKSATLKIANPHENQPVISSPCAATQARLQQAAKNPELQTKSQNESQSQQSGSFGLGGSSMTGGSSGGSRKPPASYPPFATKRSSSNASCLLKKVPGNASGKPANKNSSSNISTSSANLMPKKCGDRDEMGEGRVICTKPRQNKCGRQRKCGKDRKEKKVCKRYCCPSLQIPLNCDYSRIQCPKKGKEYSKKPEIKPEETDPTCLPNEKEQEQGREICTRPRRRRDCSRERTCDRERPCNRERRRQSCSREQSCSRNRSRSCKRQEQRDCSRNRENQGREICTKPRKRDSCNRRRCNDQNCGRRSTKCTGRRNYTHSAFTGKRKSLQNMKRYSSLPVFAFSLIGMERNDESGQKLFDPAKGRFYGKKPPPCKPPATDNKCKKPASSDDVKCKTPQKPENKCKPVKKTESICKPAKKTENKCKTAQRTENKCQIKRSETICKPMKQTETKCMTPPKKQEPCKIRSKSDDYCAKKREQLCKDRKSATPTSQGESTKDRIEREKKEMEECKKHIKRSKKDKDKKKEEKVATRGLERVVSPCKQKQTKKGEKDPSKKMSCIGIPFATANVSMPEHKPFGILPDRNYSMMRNFDFNEFGLETSQSAEERRFWTFQDDDDFGIDPIPLPVEIENQEEPFNENNSSWFRSWFNNNRS